MDSSFWANQHSGSLTLLIESLSISISSLNDQRRTKRMCSNRMTKGGKETEAVVQVFILTWGSLNECINNFQVIYPMSLSKMIITRLPKHSTQDVFNRSTQMDGYVTLFYSASSLPYCCMTVSRRRPTNTRTTIRHWQAFLSLRESHGAFDSTAMMKDQDAYNFQDTKQARRGCLGCCLSIKVIIACLIR